MIAPARIARLALTSPRGFRVIADVAREAIVVADDNRVYVEANVAACKLLERDRGSLLGARIDDVAHPSVRPGIEERWRSFLECGEGQGRYPLVRPDGSQVDVAFASVANFAPGRHISIMRPFSHVLILEDDMDLAEVLALALEGEGIPCEAPRDMSIEPDRLPALAIVDLSMPDVPALVTTLRRAGVPIVVASGKEHAEDTARAWGALRCLRKPFQVADVVRAVRSYAPHLIRPVSRPVVEVLPPTPVAASLVRFTYVDEAGRETAECVRPIAVCPAPAGAGGGWVLTGRDARGGCDRTFDLDRTRDWRDDGA